MGKDTLKPVVGPMVTQLETGKGRKKGMSDDAITTSLELGTGLTVRGHEISVLCY